MRVQQEVVLPTTPSDAWRLLVEWERQVDWMRDADEIRVLTPRREGVGVRLSVRSRILGAQVFVEKMEVRLWEPPRRLRMAHVGRVAGIGEWTLEPTDDGGTRFRWVEMVSLGLPILGELLLLAYRPLMRRLMRASMQDLRGLLIASGPSR
jgi:uncharacterized protein YndB with AHSA1/START domain